MLIKTSVKDLQVQTEGLKVRSHPEISAVVDDPSLLREAEDLLRYIVRYIGETQVLIKDSETISYGYWALRFQQADKDRLGLWEYNSEATEFIPGVNLSLKYWRNQHRVCERYSSTFSPPRPDQLAVISEGILEGDTPVQGIRYPSPKHMSGWWLTTDRYDGNIKSLKTTHMYHVTAARPDLASYIALPYGFRFEIGEMEDVWFDQKVADEPSE